jgi:hypothetical protein
VGHQFVAIIVKAKSKQMRCFVCGAPAEDISVTTGDWRGVRCSNPECGEYEISNVQRTPGFLHGLSRSAEDVDIAAAAGDSRALAGRVNRQHSETTAPCFN